MFRKITGLSSYLLLPVCASLAVCAGAAGSTQTDFSEQLKSLAGPELTLIVIDFPGYGLSRPPARTFGPDFYTEDALTAAALMQVRRMC